MIKKQFGLISLATRRLGVILVIVLLFIADIPCVLNRVFGAAISVVSDSKGDHRFLNFKLTPDNTVLDLKQDAVPEFFTRFFKKGGSTDFFDGAFLVKVPRKKFPILSVNSSQYVSIIMPATDRDNSQKDKFIAEKKAVFDRIVNMVKSGSGEVEVIIDLNKGVLINDEDPTRLKIDGTEVYLRDINGRYINHSGPYNE